MFVHLIFYPALARADAAPKLRNEVVVFVTYQGRPLADVHFDAMLLALVNTSEIHHSRSRRTPPELAKLSLTETDGRHWTPASYEWGGAGKNGQVRFEGFSPPDRLAPGDAWPPKNVRLLIDLPSEGRFLTDAGETRPYLTLLKADLRPDGTGSLSATWESLWQRLDLSYALGLTLLVELGVVIAYGWHKRVSVRRLLNLLALGVMVNVVSLPVVWFVTLESYSQFGQLRGLVCLLLAEMGATIFEGLAYAWLGRLGLSSGLWLSLLANAASMFMGLIL
jgi:hypothetical protein